MTRLRSKIITRLSETPQVYLFFGGSLEFVGSNNSIPGGPATLVAMDAYRLCSIGMLVRKVNAGGTLSIDEEATRAVWGNIADIVASESQSTRVDLSGTAVGFIGVHPAEANKSNGLRALLGHWPVDRVIMVGDSLPDYMTLPPGILQVEHYAVSNAQKEYRHLPEIHQLTQPYLAGCIEFLASIAA